MSSNRNDLYDPPAGHSNNGAPSNDRIGAIQESINNVTATMNETLENAKRRGENLDTLQYKSDQLNTSSRGFSRRANQLRKDMWWKDMRMRICIIVGIIILLIVIIVPAVVSTRH